VALLNTPGLDVRVAHIVRDPRAVAFSWLRRKPDPDLPGEGMLPRMHPGATAMYRSAWSLATERLVARAGVPYRHHPLTLDDEWTTGLSPGARRLTATLTLPLRRRYGCR
jgi:hypothetical protein